MAQKGQEPARRNFSHRDLSRRTDYPHVNSSLTEESVMGIRILLGCRRDATHVLGRPMVLARLGLLTIVLAPWGCSP